MVGGGPTLSTSRLPMMNGNKAKTKPVITMMGKAMYSPMSKAPDRSLSLGCGTIPPSDAALISSSDASHDFIFSSSDIFFFSPTDSSGSDDSASHITMGLGRFVGFRRVGEIRIFLLVEKAWQIVAVEIHNARITTKAERVLDMESLIAADDRDGCLIKAGLVSTSCHDVMISQSSRR